MVAFQLYLFGAPRLEKNGEAADINRRKTFALLAYLAVTGVPHTREALATLFWPDYDQSSALANLRRDLSRLKNLLGDEVLNIERLQVVLKQQGDLWIDVREFQQSIGKIKNHQHAQLHQCSECQAAVQRAVDLYSDKFMAGFTLPDSSEFDDWQFFLGEELRQELTEALQALIDWHAKRAQYERAIEYARRWLSLDQLHEPAHRQLIKLYAWAGQQAAAMRQFQECVRLLKQELDVEPEEETLRLYNALKTRQLSAPEPEILLSEKGEGSGAGINQQQISFCTARDGITLAYATIGQGPVLVKAANWLSHLEYDWTSPVWRHWLQALSEKHTFVRYDERGCGLSDWDVDDVSFDAWVSDLEAVVDAVGVERFPLLGISQGGAIAITYAIRHPERVSHLILYGAYTRGKLARAQTTQEKEEVDVYQKLIRLGWGKEHPAFRQVFSMMFLPEGTPEQLNAFNELQRITTTPENAARIVAGFNHIDVRALASQLRVPTLVLHARNELRIPFSEGQLLASLIPGARFVPLESINHILLEDEPAWKRFLYEVERFLEDEPGAAPDAAKAPKISQTARAETAAHHAHELTAAHVGVAAPVDSPATQVQLPSQSTPFIGRSTELVELKHMLTEDSDTQLITILGPGGIGKTRLAIEAARQSGSAFPDGVHFAPLAQLVSADNILPVLAEALSFRFYKSDEPRQQILEYLQGKNTLLVMDNFEHVVQGAELVAGILQASPGIKILVTSRERLNLTGEIIYPLAGLRFPELDSGDPLKYDAVALLLQNARRYRPTLELTGSELQAVVRICALVQGMPLALVLAAGWLEVLSLEEIAVEISKSLDILETELRDVPDRQRSLRAVFEYSWKQLSREQQQAFARLSVFRGGFTRQAAEAVAGAGLRNLLALANRSWMQRQEDGRYSIHELLRQYGYELLSADNEAMIDTRNSHSCHFASLLEALAEDMKGGKQIQAIETVEAEFENIRSAWLWSVEHDPPCKAVGGMLTALFRYCELNARVFDLMPLLEKAIAALKAAQGVDGSDLNLALLLTAQGAFYRDGTPVRKTSGSILPPEGPSIREAWKLADSGKSLLSMGFWGITLAYLYGITFDLHAGTARLRELLPIFEQQNKRWELAYAMQHLVQLLELDFKNTDLHPEIESFTMQALDIFKELGSHQDAGYMLSILGQLRRFQHRHEEAIEVLRETQEVLQAAGAWSLAADIYWQLGDLYLEIGEFKTAFECFQQVNEIYREKGIKRIVAQLLSKESYENVRYGDIEIALEKRKESLMLSQQIGDIYGEAWSLWELGEIQRLKGDFVSARQFYEKAHVLFQPFGDITGLTFYQRGLGDLAIAKKDYLDAEHHFTESMNAASESNHAWSLSYASTGAGRAAIGLGKLDAAREFFLVAIQQAALADELGILLTALAGTAEYFNAAGDNERALALSELVVGQFATWREIKEHMAQLADRIIQTIEPTYTALRELITDGPDLWQIAQIVIGWLSVE